MLANTPGIYWEMREKDIINFRTFFRIFEINK